MPVRATIAGAGSNRSSAAMACVVAVDPERPAVLDCVRCRLAGGAPESEADVPAP
jgi:hypothetical protein